jgi:hypothetical protein
MNIPKNCLENIVGKSTISKYFFLLLLFLTSFYLRIIGFEVVVAPKHTQ